MDTSHADNRLDLRIHISGHYRLHGADNMRRRRIPGIYLRSRITIDVAAYTGSNSLFDQVRPRDGCIDQRWSIRRLEFRPG